MERATQWPTGPNWMTPYLRSARPHVQVVDEKLVDVMHDADVSNLFAPMGVGAVVDFALRMSQSHLNSRVSQPSPMTGVGVAINADG